MGSAEERARWERLQRHFEEALELPAGVRAHHLEEAIPDEEMRREVAALLASHEGEGRLDSLASALSTLTDPRDGAPDPDDVPPHVGPYEIVEPIGHGGMGAVYLARRTDDPTADPVALKLLRSDVDSERVRKRFLAERAILARLDHPGIARTLDDGFTHAGLPYFVMEYVDGTPIDAHADARALPIDERVRLFLSVCEAVAHAHALGVAHRDLKPSNILVADAGVRLLDFGIAKVLDEEAFPGLGGRTTTGIHLLTPKYASPEQLLDEPITQASDQYQLGLLLYELLCGRLPPIGTRISSRFPGAGPAQYAVPPPSVAVGADTLVSGGPRDGVELEAVAALRSAAPERLEELLSGPLDRIAMRALAEEPGDRFASVADLAEALRRYLEDGEAWDEEEPAAGPRLGAWRIAALLAAGVALAALAGWALLLA